MAGIKPVLESLRARLGRRGEGTIPPSPASYFSDYGGLWTGQLDARDEIGRRLDRGAIKDSDAELLLHWVEKGYIILPQAVDPVVCERVRDDIEQAWTGGDERLLIFEPYSQKVAPLTAESPTERMRVVDAYVHLASAREALFADPIVRFLKIVFEDSPLLFQSLSFERGSQQGMHQDTAYVVVSSPLELAASWVALQDVVEGSGELMYYEGSHRLPEYHFSGEFKHWNRERDGTEPHDEWNRLIHQNAERMGLSHRTFLPKKGDALIWQADLAHGGSPVVDERLTRKSLVGHYCPDRVDPHYFSYAPERRAKATWGEGSYSSAYYAL